MTAPDPVRLAQRISRLATIAELAAADLPLPHRGAVQASLGNVQRALAKCLPDRGGDPDAE